MAATNNGMRRINTAPELHNYQKFTPHVKKKYRWLDNRGRQLTAGGILPYDETGVWVIGETDKSGNITYTDAGGKYQFEDGDIYKTIAREFGEETYHTCELTRSQVLELYNTFEPVYVNGHKNRPVYVCLVIPRLAISSLKFDSFKMKEARNEVLKNNPNVPPEYYNSVNIKHLSYDQLSSDDIRISYRLKRILKYSSLFDKTVKNKN